MHDQRFKNIHQFIACVKTGSFTEAGKLLHLSPSAISKSIQALERHLGCKLFERSTRKLQLTDAGNTYHQTCIRILQQLTETESALRLNEDLPTGKVRIALPETFGKYVVLSVLCELTQKYPELELSLHFSDRLLDLEQESIDVAVRIGGQLPLEPDEGFQLLGNENMVFCASRHYIVQHGRPKTINQLREHAIVGYQAQNGQLKPWLVPTAEGVQPWLPTQHRLLVDNSEAQLIAVCQGAGVAQLPSWLIHDKLQQGEVVRLLPDLQAKGLPLSLRYKAKQSLPPKVQVVLKALNTLRVDDLRGQ